MFDRIHSLGLDSINIGQQFLVNFLRALHSGELCSKLPESPDGSCHFLFCHLYGFWKIGDLLFVNMDLGIKLCQLSLQSNLVTFHSFQLGVQCCQGLFLAFWI